MSLSAFTYVRKIVDKYLPKPLADYSARHTPADHMLAKAYEDALQGGEQLSPTKATEYNSSVGACIYAIPCGRVDCAYTIGILARCLSFSFWHWYGQPFLKIEGTATVVITTGTNIGCMLVKKLFWNC